MSVCFDGAVPPHTLPLIAVSALQIINGIRVVKLLHWEPAYTRWIADERTKELAQVWALLVRRSPVTSASLLPCQSAFDVLLGASRSRV